jgi:hypothetical protein
MGGNVEVSNVKEVAELELSFAVCGPTNEMGMFDPPKVVRIKLDRDADDSDPSVEVIREFEVTTNNESFMETILLEDDGEWLGNGKPTDRTVITVEFGGSTPGTKTVWMHNVAPRLLGHPLLSFEAGPNGSSKGAVTVGGYYDPGVRDDHTIEVEWGFEPNASLHPSRISIRLRSR